MLDLLREVVKKGRRIFGGWIEKINVFEIKLCVINDSSVLKKTVRAIVRTVFCRVVLEKLAQKGFIINSSFLSLLENYFCSLGLVSSQIIRPLPWVSFALCFFRL